ncbi:MAG: SUMF1/EgtB/PvdO family nonheme iron enzyme [Balneolaceae bacterium]
MKKRTPLLLTFLPALLLLWYGASLTTAGNDDPDYSESTIEAATEDFEPYELEIPGSEVTLEMVPVQGGQYKMGHPDYAEGELQNQGPQRDVEVSSFWMGKYEITWQQYDLFVREVVSRLEEQISPIGGQIPVTADAIALPTPPYVDMSFGMGRDGYPAISMTHYAALMFTRWLSAKTGEFYRLPTEAEWEYACRAGSTQAAWYEEEGLSASDAEWHAGNSDGGYNRVGAKAANPFDLHDMAGNVAEWTMDQYYEDYYEKLEEEPAVNPWFRPEVLYPRSVRGGSWMDGEQMATCTERRGSEERWKMLDPQIPKSIWWHTTAPFLGFRVVRPKETPSAEEMEQFWVEPMEDF